MVTTTPRSTAATPSAPQAPDRRVHGPTRFTPSEFRGFTQPAPLTLPDEARRVAATIDHTLLKPETTGEDVRALCADAIRYGFAAVCINPYWVPVAVDALHGTRIAVCSVAGFPLGANSTSIKVAEATQIVEMGGREVDMVVNLGRLRAGEYRAVEADIAAVRRAIPRPTVLKVILETAALTPDEKSVAARLTIEAGADFVKTSTGFHAAGGATLHDVRLLRAVVRDRAGVKASGGIRDTAAALAMLEAGATRIGTSNGVAVVTGLLQDRTA